MPSKLKEKRLEKKELRCECELREREEVRK
jgi:hypothetical protein